MFPAIPWLRVRPQLAPGVPFLAAKTPLDESALAAAVAVRALIGFTLLLISIRPVSGQSVAFPNRNVTAEIVVQIHDYVQVPQQTLTRAEEVTSGILREAGVEVVWVNCNFGITAEKPDPACSRPLGSLDLVVNLVDRIQLLSPKLRETTMGLAVVPPDGGEGNLAYISMRQAASVAHESSVPMETILGLGAAHELGHLLLCEVEHTSSGLMKSRLGLRELELGSHGKLLFTPEQSDRIRTNLLARLMEASNSATAIQVSNSAVRPALSQTADSQR